MDCTEFRRLSRTPLREQAPAWREAAAEHATGCPRCAMELDFEQALGGEIASLASVDPSSSFADGVMKQIAALPAQDAVLVREAPSRAPSMAARLASATTIWATAIGGTLLLAPRLCGSPARDWLPALSRVSLLETNRATDWLAQPSLILVAASLGAALLLLGIAARDPSHS